MESKTAEHRSFVPDDVSLEPHASGCVDSPDEAIGFGQLSKAALESSSLGSLSQTKEIDARSIFNFFFVSSFTLFTSPL